MANRRMISKSISISEQVNELSDFAALLFSWMIPHADDWGVLPGSPKQVKALVIPMRRQSAKEVEKAIREMVSQELIWWYEVDGKLYIQFRTFDKHQEGLHKRTKPKNPVFPGNSGKLPEIPGQENRTEENRTEENYIYSVFNHWNKQEIIKHKTLTKKIKGHINARKEEGHTVEEVCEAIDNYKSILDSDLHYWTHKWTLAEFLQRGLDKFKTESDPFTNYRTKNKDSPNSKGDPLAYLDDVDLGG